MKNNSNFPKRNSSFNNKPTQSSNEKHRNSTIKYQKLNYQHSGKERIHIFIESNFFKTYSTLLTILALYIDDIKKLTTTQSSDSLFDLITIVIICLFGIEVFLYFFVDEQYGCGLFFWIDIVGIVSMILDISAISDKIVYGDTSGIQQVRSNRMTLMKISKSLKIIRIVRITKLVKMFNHLFRGKNKEDEKVEGDISSRFEDFSSKKMIILIILLLIAIIIFNPNYYYSMTTEIEYGIQLFNDIADDNIELLNDTFNLYIDFFKDSNKYPIIYANIYGFEYANENFSSKLRLSEKLSYYDNCYGRRVNKDKKTNSDIVIYLTRLGIIPSSDVIEDKCIAIFDNRYASKLTCKLDMIKTSAILVIFVIGFLLFCVDIENLVLKPIENMTQKIENMAKNPISSMDDNSNNNQKDNKNKCLSLCTKSNVEMLETQVLENKISKICAMLALGFGEAGSQIISSVLQEGVNVEMNPIIPGKKVMGIYGFCDIRNFTDTTEVLQQQVMIFVNQVAEIVHELVSDYCGSANKNIGDAFLLVWKFDDKFIKPIINSNGKPDLRLRKCEQVSQFCDMALISFIKILIQITKSYKLAVYKKHAGLNARMKNYRVRLGFGLHLGRSIEGAIGSMFKIDASYLSPDVNMANALEEKTKDFSKELIMSGDFVDFLSEDARKNLRLLDVIKAPSGEVNRYYSIDMDFRTLQIEKKEDSIFKDDDLQNKLEKIMEKRKKAKDLYYDVVKRHKNDVWKEFVNNDVDYPKIRERYTPEFIETYNNGMQKYVEGKWDVAKTLLMKAESILGDKDVPSDNILEYMKQFNYIAPSDWEGYKDESKK